MSSNMSDGDGDCRICDGDVDASYGEPMPSLSEQCQIPQDQMKVDRPHANELRRLTASESQETYSTYTEFFERLQIRPEYHERFWNQMVYVVRQKHIELLKRGTDASITDLTKFFIRGYGYIAWPVNSSWLVEDPEGGRIVHVKGTFERNTNEANERLFQILEQMWWKMRETAFTTKQKVRRGRKSNAENNHIYEDENITKLHKTSRSTLDKARSKTLDRIGKMIDKAPEPAAPRVMTATQTEDAIIKLIIDLADTRANSDPELFSRLWDQHIGRVDEIEACANANANFNKATNSVASTSKENIGNENVNSNGHGHGNSVASTSKENIGNEGVNSNGHGNSDGTTCYSADTQPFPPEIAEHLPKPQNLVNEPFESTGNPIPQPWPRPLQPQVPASMLVLISTSPSEGMYRDRAYYWPDAPVRMVDQRKFYEGLMMRIEMPNNAIAGFVFSYGWCDVARWIAANNIDEGGDEAIYNVAERRGWDTFQRDLARSADLGVRIWRMKVLVVRKRN